MATNTNTTDLEDQVKANTTTLARVAKRADRVSSLVDEVYQLKQAVAELQQKVVDLLNK
jgi:predicted  nucleic acid-binding Zn-ribbon protein